MAFQALQYNITMHNSHYDEVFFASAYVAGLKDDIRAAVEPHVPLIVDRAALIAKIQQRNKREPRPNITGTLLLPSNSFRSRTLLLLRQTMSIFKELGN